MATIRDVAQLAGVSIATVSRVLNDSSRVRASTRQRVWAAFDDLDFSPNGAARSLTTRRTNVLGVLLPDLYGEFFSEVIRGIDLAARREGLHTLVSSAHAETQTILSAARSMRGRIDGAIVMAPDASTAEAIHRIRDRFPVVLLNARFEVPGCSSISIANLEGAHEVVKHLLRLGHEPIAILKGPLRKHRRRGTLARIPPRIGRGRRRA
jgi:LacI family transcriptional regulator